MSITLPSIMSLIIEMSALTNSLATGTGFLVDHEAKKYLVTNRHNLSGRNTETNEPLSKLTGAVPDTVTVLHTSSLDPISWQPRSYPLYDDNDRPLWLEHAEFGRAVDVAVLPIPSDNQISYCAYDLERKISDLDVHVADELSIIGFPFGKSSEAAFGIWIRGVVASDMEIDYNGLPSFLIDSRTRKGQSGSPVIFYSRSGMIQHGGGATFGRPNVYELQGIYSGRINEESDLGIVWKTKAIRDIIERGNRPEHNRM